MEKTRKPYYKYCVVPMCQNNIKTAPDKVYFLMPKDASIRKKWCKAMRRDNVSCLSTLYCCEDHFNIEEDTENHIQYKIMALEHGQKVTLQLKKGVVPYIFQCQKKDMWQPPPERKGAMKRKRRALVEEALAEAALTDAALTKAGPSIAPISKSGHSATSISEVDLPEAGPSIASISEADLLEAGSSMASVPYHMDVELISDKKIDREAASNIFLSNAQCSKDILQLDKAVQVNCKVHYRSKGVNVNLTAKKNSIALSPLPILSKNTSTSPLKSSQTSFVKKKLCSDNTCERNNIRGLNSQSSVSPDYEREHSSSDTSWLIEDESDSDLQFKSLMRSGTLMAIEKEPKMLLGLPKKRFI